MSISSIPSSAATVLQSALIRPPATTPSPAKTDNDGDRDGSGSPSSAGLVNVKV